MAKEETVISTDLTKKLLFGHLPNQRVTNEALEAASFLLRQFIVEARNRASVEAAFDPSNEGDEDEDGNISQSGKKRDMIAHTAEKSQSQSLLDDEKESATTRSTKKIKPNHILRISAELLMDFA